MTRGTSGIFRPRRPPPPAFAGGMEFAIYPAVSIRRRTRPAGEEAETMTSAIDWKEAMDREVRVGGHERAEVPGTGSSGSQASPASGTVNKEES